MLKKHPVVLFILFCLFCVVAFYTFSSPSNDRQWNEDQQVLPYAHMDGNSIHVYNIRNFTYYTTSNYTSSYYNKTFDLSKLQTVHFVVEPFSDWKGAAHTLLSFGFEGDEYLAISVEIRKEKGESFSALKGLFNQYEIMYVVADEQDVIKLRSNFRNDSVYLYPINAPKDKLQELFLDMLKRTNKVAQKPEFYNTLTNTCTTNIVRHVNTISPKRIPFDLRVLAPGYSDKLAYELGLIDTSLSFEETREIFKINDRAMQYGNSSDFSIRIREFN